MTEGITPREIIDAAKTMSGSKPLREKRTEKTPEEKRKDYEKDITEIENLSPEELALRIEETLGDGDRATEIKGTPLKLYTGWREAVILKDDEDFENFNDRIYGGEITDQKIIDQRYRQALLKMAKEEVQYINEMKKERVVEKNRDRLLPEIKKFLETFNIPFHREREAKKTRISLFGPLGIRLASKTAKIPIEANYAKGEYNAVGIFFDKEGRGVPFGDKDTLNNLLSAELHEFLHIAEVQQRTKSKIRSGMGVKTVGVPGVKNASLNEATTAECQEMILKNMGINLKVDSYIKERTVLKKLPPFANFVRAAFTEEGLEALEQQMNGRFGEDALGRLQNALTHEIKTLAEKGRRSGKLSETDLIPVQLLENLEQGRIESSK